MTEVAFHSNVAGKISHACRLVRKAWSSGARVVVTGEPSVLRELDVTLWTFAEREFIPHCIAGAAPAHVQARSPVVLAVAPMDAAHRQVLINLGSEVPEGFERFDRLIEVVSREPEDRGVARQRWKHYKDRGYALVNHDIGEARA